ncbi:hypothetical protein [Streptomyces sp. AK02-01A]|uniref:hypothetical protein n=1 Tax=Streptomyces sp. AK02-01A TaxID=3028648 RepID=UPI0029B9B4C5|nr:hypothetical protein [Streptomyces sp. AK02-01A]MDX3854218.1 hypothetical protein [Streptomyces sp. AK02-01A]
MPVVFCKPDALSGPRRTVTRERAVALLTALAGMCSGTGAGTLVPVPWRSAAERAAVQVSERARTETPFQGAVREGGTASAQLLKMVDALPAGVVATSELLELSLGGLGFGVRSAHRLVLGEVGVDAVYAGATTTTEYEPVRARLLEYLAAEEVEVWDLEAGQAACVLQWWKTYVRHLLLDRRPGEYLLRNLVHVCDGPDADYLLGRVHGTGH